MIDAVEELTELIDISPVATVDSARIRLAIEHLLAMLALFDATQRANAYPRPITEERHALVPHNHRRRRRPRGRAGRPARRPRHPARGDRAATELSPHDLVTGCASSVPAHLRAARRLPQTAPRSGSCCAVPAD